MNCKLIHNLFRDKNVKRKFKFYVFILCLVVVTIFFKLILNTKINLSETIQDSCESFDIVYTWVNGSDPKFIKSIRKYDPNYDPARFDDKNELKYSLRSLEKFAPWMRHVYIITNGQIPHWLDLSYEKVSIVVHEQLSTNIDYLPTFSSSAIETFLHRIPNLSKRFLYLNDDIFLGSRLYTEDLYTESEGVRIYTAWTVPDCAADCPWVYIGDGACDQHCNIEKCQFDGNDCVNDTDFNDKEKFVENKPKVDEDKTFYDVSKIQIEDNKKSNYFLFKRNKRSSFKDVINSKNITNSNELENVINNFNTNQKLSMKTSHHFRVESNSIPKQIQSSKDVYSQSLINTNMFLNKIYGFKSRNVLGHVGFLLDKTIISEMQNKFHQDIELTASHRFRDTTDLQFAFLYYNFIISETINRTIDEIFFEFDTDKSTTWSDREIRTVLTRLFPLPLEWAAVRYFEEIVTNCSLNLKVNKIDWNDVPYPTLVYERYEDSSIPTVSNYLVSHCDVLVEALLNNFSQKPKYKFTINPKRGMHSNFMMLTSNISEVVDSLDRFRRSPKKFNCINDNLEPHLLDDNEIIRHLLEDFYLSFFPKRSKFELPDHYRNRFTDWNDYQKWKADKNFALIFGYMASAILIGFLFKFCCLRKAKYVRRYVQNL